MSKIDDWGNMIGTVKPLAEMPGKTANLTSADIDKMQEWEREVLVQDETGKNGTWTLSGDILGSEYVCPTCESMEHTYIYQDSDTCYCLNCAIEFTVSDLEEISELGESPNSVSFDVAEMFAEDELNQLTSDDPEVVKLLAERILAAGEAKAESGKQQAKNMTRNWTPKAGQVSTGTPTTKTPVPSNTYWDGDTSGVGFKYVNTCYHRPQHIIAGEGWGVWAGKKDDCKRHAKEFDLVLNLTYMSIKDTHVIPVPALAKYQDFDCNFKELQLDWPDYGVVNLPRQFWLDLIEYAKENKFRILVFCQGGHGRTGTAISVLLCLALGYTPANAIAWVRKNYCNNAVETMSQAIYVSDMADTSADETVEAAPLGEKKDASASMASASEN